MSVSDHLKELRNRIAVCIVIFILAFFMLFAVSSKLVEILTSLGSKYGYRYIYISPQEYIIVYFEVAMTSAFILTLPLIIWQIYAYSSPIIENKKTKAKIIGVLFFGVIFFMLGVAFAYFVSVPFTLKFLIEISRGTRIAANISIQAYISFIITVLIIFGVIFEIPILSVLFSIAGLLKPHHLINAQKPAIVLIFIIAAIITPPDVVSQIIMAIPMVILYQLSIFLCRIFSKKTN